MKKRTHWARMAGLAVVVLSATGCSVSHVKPWERDWLAQPEMTPGATDAINSALDDHIYFSKEGASGGRSFGGGGCGCN